jgi:hypothetical protein
MEKTLHTQRQLNLRRLNSNFSKEVLITLNSGELYPFNGNSRGTQILCQKGRLWVTQEGDLEDYILLAGDSFQVTQRGKVLIESLCEARLKITPASR